MRTTNKISFKFYKYNAPSYGISAYPYIIALWQWLKRNKYWYFTHVELIEEKPYDYVVRYSAVIQKGVTRKLFNNSLPFINESSTELVDITVYLAENRNLEPIKWFEKHLGDDYDLKAIIFHEFISLKIEDKGKSYCSEACAASIGINPPQMNVSQFYSKVMKLLNKDT